VDSEIRIIIDSNYDIAYKILEENRDILDSMAAALVEFETIDTGQIDDLWLENQCERQLKLLILKRFRPSWGLVVKLKVLNRLQMTTEVVTAVLSSLHSSK